MNILTDKQIRGAKTKLSSNGRPIKYEIVDSTGERGVGRLVLRVSATGSKEFAYKYKVDGQRKYIAIGKYPAMSLVGAREAILPLVSLLRSGVDPKEHLEREKAEQVLIESKNAAQGSIESLFHEYTEKMKRDKKRTYSEVLKSLEKETYQVIPKATKAKDVTRDQIKLVLAKMIQRGAVVQSNRVRSYLMAAFNFGLEHDNDPASIVNNLTFGIENNPVIGIPKQRDAEKVGNRYLTYQEIKYLFQHFGDTPRVGRMVEALLKLCFYTGGQRPNELAATKWKNVKFDHKTLLITEDISKNKREHMVPLSNQAISLLSNIKDNQKSETEFVFPQRLNIDDHIHPSSLSKAVRRFREEHPEFEHFVPRDIRRTCKTLMGELGISKTDRDRLQNHALNDVSSKHYDRYEYLREKQLAIEIWNSKLSELFNNN